MKLYLMRHGPAEDQADSGIDGDRALTAKGRERVRAVAAALASAGEEPCSILASPLVRAVQTAEGVAIVTRLGERGGTVEVRREMSPAGDVLGLVRALASSGRERVMLVGHEPDLGDVVSSLLGAGGSGRSFDKAMVVGVEVPARPRDSGAGRPSLRFVLDPQTLRVEPAH